MAALKIHPVGGHDDGPDGRGPGRRGDGAHAADAHVLPGICRWIFKAMAGGDIWGSDPTDCDPPLDAEYLRRYRWAALRCERSGLGGASGP